MPKSESYVLLWTSLRGVTMEDYSKLQENLQHREEEIRCHFKIQIQQKLYQTELEDQISVLEKAVK